MSSSIKASYSDKVMRIIRDINGTTTQMRFYHKKAKKGDNAMVLDIVRDGDLRLVRVVPKEDKVNDEDLGLLLWSRY